MFKALRVFTFVLASAYASAALGQTAVRGDCVRLVEVDRTSPVFSIDLNACKPAQPNAIPDITIAVYQQSTIDDKLKVLNDKIDKLSSDAVDAVRKTVDGQAIKADDVSRIVKATRDQIYVQLKNDIAKAVQDAVRQTLQEQIAAEVAKQLAQKPKQP